MGQALGICLSPNFADATSASHVDALEPVSNATGCSSSALTAVLSKETQVASGLSSGSASIATARETASVRTCLRERPFSEAVTHHLCQTIRASTAGVYDCKWRVYELVSHKTV